jgi:hypothetical protein
MERFFLQPSVLAAIPPLPLFQKTASLFPGNFVTGNYKKPMLLLLELEHRLIDWTEL